MKGVSFDTDRIVWAVLEWIEALERDDARERCLKAIPRYPCYPYPLQTLLTATIVGREVAALAALTHKQITRRERIRDRLETERERKNREYRKCSTMSINSGQADARRG